MTNTAYTSTSMPFNNTYNQASSRKDDIKDIKVSALRYLARREYSRVELYRKLCQKFSAADAIQAVLDELKEQGYQSDTRFTESFIRAKVNAGNGPFKIKIELREKGICESTALAAFDRQSVDWLVLAENVKKKRFGSDIATTLPLNELAKQVRYLKNKGFYQEHIDQVIKPSRAF